MVWKNRLVAFFPMVLSRNAPELGGLLGSNPPAPADVPKKALLFSRINLWLSAPMFVGMIAASHADLWTMMPSYLHGIFMLLALGAVHGMLKLAPKKGTGL